MLCRTKGDIELFENAVIITNRQKNFSLKMGMCWFLLQNPIKHV